MAALLAAVSCGGSTPTLPDGNDRLTAGQGLIDSPVQPDEAYLSPEWQAVLKNPGVPGEDYDPNYLTVNYKMGVVLPESFVDVKPTTCPEAAAQPNSILRVNKQYERVTNAIAARHGLIITDQVYDGELNFSGFRLPDGADGDAVIAAITGEFADYIKYATYSRLLDPCFVPNDPDYTSSGPTTGRLWGYHKINCSTAWDFTKGRSTEWIAVVDTGIRMTHEELAAQVIPESELIPLLPADSYLDISQDGNYNNTIEDNDGHGTFIAGLVASQGENGRSMLGIAYHSRIVPIKISDGGSVFDAKVAAGCKLGNTLGARTVSLSFGRLGAENPVLTNMVNSIHNNGGLVVVSAGNEDSPNSHWPSDCANAISVGATDKFDNRSSFSNYSTGVDIAAPGQQLYSTGNHEDNDYHANWDGTSFASPMVAAACALIWSFEPSLTNDEVRDLLVLTAAPTSGFQNTNPPVGRLDLAAAFAELNALKISAPKPDRLIQSGTIQLAPTVVGDPDSVEMFVNGELSQTQDMEPWAFSLDTSSTNFGKLELLFRANRGGESTSAELEIIVDNTSGSFPMSEDFEAASRSFYGVDIKGYANNVIQATKQIPGPGGEWTYDLVGENGPAVWGTTFSSPYQGNYSMQLGAGLNNYGAYELDALVSRRVNLNGISDATMVFYHHYNIEDSGSALDKGWVYVTDDNGQTFFPAKLKAGPDAFYSGYDDSWGKAEVDLSAFTGLVNVVFVFESNATVSGQSALGQPGWWVDLITIATDYAENVPSIGEVTPAPYTAYGVIPGVEQIQVSIADFDNVDRMRFILDVAPLGLITPEDQILDLSAAPFEQTITLPGVPNQLANLRIQYFDADNVAGPEVVVPVYIFNLLGDTNADNIVNAADMLGYPGQIGKLSTDPGYIPLYDSDQDGEVTEADAAAVGYYWGQSI